MTKVNGFRVWDTHFHCGRWWVSNNNAGGYFPSAESGRLVLRDFLAKDTFEIVNHNLDGNDVKLEKIFVSNLDCIAAQEPNGRNFLRNEYDGNIDLINRYKGNPNVFCYAVCQPSNGNIKNIEKLFAEYPNMFVGLKLHPTALKLPANSFEYDDYMKFAQKHKLPCLFHSAVAIDWTTAAGKVIANKDKWDCADPRLIYELAKRYPDVPVILGHTGAGGDKAHQVAINVLLDSIAHKNANLYAEISWLDFAQDGLPSKNSKNLISLIRELKEKDKLDRIVFGTDAPLGCYGETAKVSVDVSDAYFKTLSRLKAAIKSNFPNEADDILNKILHENAKKLFDIKEAPVEMVKKVVSNQVQNLKNSKSGYVVGGVLGTIGAFLVLNKIFFSKTQSKK